MARILYKVLLRLVPAWFFLLVVSVYCYGQKTTEVMVYCNDGSIYRGELVGEDDKTLQIVIEQDTLNVSKVRVKAVREAGDYLFHPKGKFHDTKGFFWSMNLGFSTAGLFTEQDMTSGHFELLFGYRFNKRWTIASGLGSELNTSQIGEFLIETGFSSYFLYGRYYFTDGRPRLFAYSRLGFGAGQAAEDAETNINNKGGIQWQAGGGIHFASRKNARFIISWGYYLQKTSGTQFFLDDFGNEVKVDFDMLIQRPILKLGIEFR